MGQFNRFKHANSGQRGFAAALALCMPIECLELLDPAAGAADDLRDAAATVASEVTVLAAALKAAGLTKLTEDGAPARSITFTTAGGTAAHAPASVAITGLGPSGDVQTETLNLAQTATVVESAKCYSSIASLVFPAADGTDATIAIGIGNKFAFPTKAKLRAGRCNVIRETESGATPTAGTFATPTASGPNGAYTPNSTPNGTLDFVVCYETDIAQFPDA